MRKKAKTKIFNTEYYDNPFDGSGRNVPKIQLNPLSAFARSDSKLYVQQVLSGLSMLAIIAVVAIGGLGWVRKQQAVTVNADVNYKKSVRGTVVSVNIPENKFILKYESSIDEKVSATGREEWEVMLPPGEFLTADNRAVSATCFSIPDLKSLSSKATSVPCGRIVQTGRELLVEYVVLYADKGQMIAKTILGQE